MVIRLMGLMDTAPRLVCSNSAKWKTREKPEMKLATMYQRPTLLVVGIQQHRECIDTVTY